MRKKFEFKTRFEKKKKKNVTFTLVIHSSIFLQISHLQKKIPIYIACWLLGLNRNLFTEIYHQVFGEALLNDGVTFVLYEGVKELALVATEDLSRVAIVSYVWVILSFLTASVGGIVIGFVVGLFAALITKYTR